MARGFAGARLVEGLGELMMAVRIGGECGQACGPLQRGFVSESATTVWA